MRKTTRVITGAAIAAAVLFAVSPAARADQYVHGYTRSDGTYVQPYWRSDPDGDPYNNYGFPGNLNPYTGKTAPGNVDTYLRNYYDHNSSGWGALPWPDDRYGTDDLELPGFEGDDD